MSDEIGTVTFQKDYENNVVTVVGEIPKRVAVSAEFIDNAMGVTRDGDDVYLNCVPPLHLRLLHPHPEVPRTFVAEVVTE